MKIDPHRFHQDLEAGRRVPVYLFHGQEAFLIDQAVEEALATLVDPETADFNLDVLNAADHPPGEVVNRLAQFPLLGGSRVVLVKHLEEVKKDWQEGLISCLQNPPEQSHLILASMGKVRAGTIFFKAVDKAGVVVEFSTPPERELLGWLGREAREKGKKIDSEARMLLLARVGPNLAGLAAELEKLALFVHPAETIDSQAVRDASAAPRGYVNFDLGQAVGRRDALKALTVLHHLDLTASGPEKARLYPALVGLLAFRLRSLWRAQSCLEQGLNQAQAAKVLKLPPFFVREYLDQAKEFSQAELAEATLRLHQTDRRIKTGSPGRESLESFILWICR